MGLRKVLIVEDDNINLVYKILQEQGLKIKSEYKDISELSNSPFPILLVSKNDSININNKILTYKDIKVDDFNKTIYVNSNEIYLTYTEYKILKLLIEYKEKVFTKENLFKSIWNEEYLGDYNIINAHMSNLRRKLKRANNEEKYIETIWGLGYRLYKEK